MKKLKHSSLVRQLGFGSIALTLASANGYAATPSMSGAIYDTAHPTAIVDASSNSWKITSGYAYQNGVKDTSHSNVIYLLYFGGVMYEELSNYTWNCYKGGAWVTRGSLGDPRATSADGANIPAASFLVDSSHDVWLLSGGKVYENGAAAGSTDNVISVVFKDKAIYLENTSKLWWHWNGTTWVTSASLVAPEVSANGATIPPATQLVDSAHHVWTLVGGVVKKDGVNAGTSSNVALLTYCDGVIYQTGTNKLVFAWNGGSWVPSNSVEFLLPSDVKSVGYTNRIFHDDFDNLDSIDIYNTLAPGYYWYMKSYASGHVTPPSYITHINVDGVTAIRFDPNNSSIYGAYKSGSANIGPQFAMRKNGGAYYEANIALGETGPSTNAWPAFWANPTAHMLNENVSWNPADDATKNPSYAHYLEFDFMEYFANNGGAYPNHYNSTVIDWYGVYKETCPTSAYCKAQLSQPLGPGTQLSIASTETHPVFHKFGALWVPSIKQANGTWSTGSVRWYLDGQLISYKGNKVEWTGKPPLEPPTPATPVSPWRYSVLDRQTMSLNLDTGSGAFMYVDYVDVWQLP